MNRVITENRVIEAIVEYLKSMDYPDECIAVGWGDRKISIDIAILAYDLVTPLAIFELKTIKSGDTIRRGIEYLRKAASTLDIVVRSYLAFYKEDGRHFELYDVTSIVYTDEVINTVSVLNDMEVAAPLLYKTLQNGIKGKIEKRERKKRQNRIDRIKPVCWLLIPILILTLFLLDALKIYELTALRLITFGGLIVIILIPFYSEISLKDFTLKRKDNSNE